MSDEPVVDVRDATFSYDGYTVIENASFQIREHDFVTIVGPNGGGKTTLLKLMLGLLQPSGGTVLVFGRPPAEVGHRIGYMPQHAHLDPQFPVNVMDVTLMGRLGRGSGIGPYTKEDREAAEKALRTMRIEEKKNAGFSALSGGQRQRVLIARALASDPDLLLLDEPSAGLDLSVETELYDILLEFSKRITVVVVSHDLGFVSHYVNRVVCVKRNVAVHPTAEISGQIISDMYGAPMKMVRHDHDRQDVVTKCLNS